MKNTKLRKYFEEKAMNATKVAKIVGITPKAVYDHLNGKGMSRELVKEYHEKLGIPLEILVEL